MAQGAKAITEKYIAVDYIQHQVGGKNGRAAMLESMTRPRPAGSPSAPMPPATLIFLGADGDKVVQVTSRSYPDPATGELKPRLIWNMFRVKDGQLAEHWDVLPAAMTAPAPGAGPGPAPGGQPR